MRIVYRKRRVLTVCEMQLNRLMLLEPGEAERIVAEDDERIFTAQNTYRKVDLVW